ERPVAETPRIAGAPAPIAPVQELPKSDVGSGEIAGQPEVTATPAPDQKAVNADGSPAKRRRGRRGGRRRKRADAPQTQGQAESPQQPRDIDDEDREPSRSLATHEQPRQPEAHRDAGSLSAHASFATPSAAPAVAPTGASTIAEIRQFPSAAAPSPAAISSPANSMPEPAPIAARPQPPASAENALGAGNADAAAPLPSPSEGEAAMPAHRPALGAAGGMGAAPDAFAAPSATRPAFSPQQGDLLPKPAKPTMTESSPASENGGESAGSN